MPDKPSVAQGSLTLQRALTDVSEDVDARFDALLGVPDDPRADLFRAMRHAAIGGGKRLRPLLVFATARLFGVDRDCAGAPRSRWNASTSIR